MIKREAGKYLYYDKNGAQITAGCKIRYPDGSTCVVYATVDGELGTDATNPKWFETGKACECEYGIYPLTLDETYVVTVVDE